MKNLQTIIINKKTYLSFCLVFLVFYFLYFYEPESLFNIIKKYVFASYQNIEIEKPGIFLFASLAFYFFSFLYLKKFGTISGFSLFVILYHLFDVFKGWTKQLSSNGLFIIVLLASTLL